jgi:L-rhamnose 1-dehydrogenase
MGGSAFLTRTDVSKAEHVSNLIVTTLSKYGTIDVLVDDAGICPFRDFLDMPVET